MRLSYVLRYHRSKHGAATLKTPIALVLLVLLAHTGCQPSLAKPEQSQPSTESRTALEQGYQLLRQHQYAAAVPLLDRATEIDTLTPHVELLIVRAIVEGELEEAYDRAAALADGLRANTKTLPALREEAAYHAAKLAFLRGNEPITRATAFLDSDPPSKWADDIRFRLARAQLDSQHPDARATLESIYYDTPSSPWAREARERLQSTSRRLSPNDHSDFLVALQSAGLHAEAIDEAELFHKRHDTHARTDDVLYRQVISLHALRRNRACVAAAERLWREHPRSPHRQAAGILAIRALRRSNATREIRAWAKRLDDPEARYQLGTYLANVVDRDEGIVVLRDLMATSRDRSMVGKTAWKLTWYLREADQVIDAISALDNLLARFPDTGFRPAALYWLARFTEPIEPAQAKRLYQVGSDEKPYDYYGLMSRRRLEAMGVTPNPITAEASSITIDPLDDPTRLRAPAYRRGVELAQLGIHELAALELDTLQTNDRGLLLAKARLHALTGRTRERDVILERHFANQLEDGPRALDQDLWRVVHPLAFQPDITRALEAHQVEGLDHALVAALILQESRYQSDIVSAAGAVGLMQLMPTTAETLAPRIGLDTYTYPDLFHPPSNIQLGVALLARRIQNFDGQWVPAIASYNADIRAVKGWWNRRGDKELDEFIDTIPYLETRLYVKKIIANREVYRQLYFSGGY